MRFPFLSIPAFLLISILISACGNNEDSAAKIENQSDSLSNPIALLEKSIQAYPDSLILLAKLSDLQEESGQIDKAMATLEKGLKQDSTAIIFLNRQASLLLTKGDTGAAITGLLKSLSYAPEQTDIHVELGFLYATRKKNNALVVADFLLSQADQPQLQTKARYMKGIYYANIGNTKLALEQFNECIINDYTFIDAYMEKGIILHADKKYTEALKVFEKVLTISNTYAEAYYWSGRCLEGLNRKEEALDFYKKTIGLDGKFKEAEEAIDRLTIR